MRRILPILLCLSACGDDHGGQSDGGTDGASGDGVGAADAFDLDGASCETASASPLEPGAAITGSTADADNLTEGTCGGRTSGEAYHVISVPVRADVLLSTEGEATTFDTVVYLRAVCQDTTSELGCASTGSLGDSLLVRDVAPGLYYVIVDGVAGGQGPYTISLAYRPIRQLGEPCDLAADADRCNDGLRCEGDRAAVCADPFAPICITAAPARSGDVLAGNLAGESALEPDCAAGGADALYAVELTEPGFVYAVEEGGALTSAALYLRGPGSCNPTYELRCDAEANGLRLLSEPLAAGTYYLVVDGSGDYRVALTVGENLEGGAACDPASTRARCDTGLGCLSGQCQAVERVEDISPNADFCDAQGPYAGDFVVNGRLTTGGSTDEDTFRVDLAAAGTLRVETSDGMGGCSVNTLVEVFAKGGSSCSALDNGSPTPIATDDDSGPTGGCSALTTASLAPGGYYVRVRRGGSGAGAYILTVDIQ